MQGAPTRERISKIKLRQHEVSPSPKKRQLVNVINALNILW